MIKQEQGIIALTTVLIIGSIILVIGIGMSLQSIMESDTSFDEELSHQALVAATSCMEQALLTLADDASYIGDQTIVVGSHTCTVAVITGSGNERTVKTSSTVNGHTRRLLVSVSNVNPPLQVSSWQEVSSF